VSVAGARLSGADAGNYRLGTIETTGTITDNAAEAPTPLSVTGLRAVTKTFDATTHATLVATIQPVMFLLLFNFVFGGAIGGTLPQGLEYIQWLMPGLLIQIAAFGSVQTALGLAEDLDKGVIDRFRSLPMARSAVLTGRGLSDLIRNAFVLSLMLVLAFVLGFRWETGPLRFLAGLALALGLAFALSWVVAAVTLVVRTPEAVEPAVFLPIFPLVFASSVFLPTDTMPDWLRVFADNQPFTVIADAIRALMLGRAVLPVDQTVSGQVLLAVAWIVVMTLTASAVSVRMYRRMSS